jgi:hypothetical protein
MAVVTCLHTNAQAAAAANKEAASAAALEAATAAVAAGKQFLVMQLQVRVYILQPVLAVAGVVCVCV